MRVKEFWNSVISIAMCTIRVSCAIALEHVAGWWVWYARKLLQKETSRSPKAFQEFCKGVCCVELEFFRGLFEKGRTETKIIQNILIRARQIPTQQSSLLALTLRHHRFAVFVDSFTPGCRRSYRNGTITNNNLLSMSMLWIASVRTRPIVVLLY